MRGKEAGYASGDTQPTEHFIQQLAETLSCPISLEVMEDPVIASDGRTYDRQSIEMWLQRSVTVVYSPLTCEVMDRNLESLRVNYRLRDVLEEYKKFVPEFERQKLTQEDLALAIQVRENELADYFEKQAMAREEETSEDNDPPPAYTEHPDAGVPPTAEERPVKLIYPEFNILQDEGDNAKQSGDKGKGSMEDSPNIRLFQPEPKAQWKLSDTIHSEMIIDIMDFSFLRSIVVQDRYLVLLPRSSSRSIPVWDLEKKELALSIDLPSGVRYPHGICLLPDGRFAIGAHYTPEICVYDLPNTEPVGIIDSGHRDRRSNNRSQTTQNGIHSMVCLPNGYILSASECGANGQAEIRMHNSETGEFIWSTFLIGGSPYIIAVPPSGDWAAFSCTHHKKSTTVWDMNSRALLCQFKPGAREKLLALSDERLVSASDKGEIAVYDIPSKRRIKHFKAHKTYVSDLKITPAGHLVTAGFLDDPTIKIWDLDSETCLRVINPPEVSWVNALEILPDGRLVSGTSKEGILLWDLYEQVGVEENMLSGPALPALG